MASGHQGQRRVSHQSLNRLIDLSSRSGFLRALWRFGTTAATLPTQRGRLAHVMVLVKLRGGRTRYREWAAHPTITEPVD